MMQEKQVKYAIVYIIAEEKVVKAHKIQCNAMQYNTIAGEEKVVRIH